jgi:enoyl-CoA hydratase
MEGTGNMTRPRETEHTAVTISADGVATVEIANAGVLNVLSTPVLTDVTAVVSDLAASPDLRALVLRGAGDRAFIGGADIKEMVTLDAPAARAFITCVAGLCEVLRQFPTPVIARLPGWTLGAGLEVAAACDIRIASSDAHFGMPEVAVGIPSVVHAALLPRMIGQARAGWLLLTAQNVDAPTALSWGLIDEICDGVAALDAAVSSSAQRFVEFGSEAVRQQKRLLRSWQDLPIGDAVTASIDEFASAFETGEPQRFMSAFLTRKR